MTEQQLGVGGPSRATRDNLVWNTEALSGHQIDSRLSGVDGDLFLKYFQVRVQTYSSRRYVFFALGLANSDSELWTAAGDNLSDALLGAAAAITIRVGDLSLTVPGPNHSSYSTVDDSEPYHWRWDFPVTETGHPSRAVSDFLAGFSELSGEEQSRTQIVLSDQDAFTEPTLPPPSVLADAASVNLEEPLDLSSAGYNDVLRLGIKPSSEDQVFRIWATLAYSVEGSVAGSRVGSRLVRNGDVNLSQILHPASSEMVRYAARTPKYFFVADAPGTVEEVTYALSLFESEAAGASPRAQRGLSLYVEALSGEFEVVEKFVADSLPPPPPPPPPPPSIPGAISTLELTVNDERTVVTGSWGESSDADEYKLVWKKAGTVASTVYVSTRTATFTDFTPGQRVELEVRGVNDTRGQEGPVKSESIGTSPPAPPPPIPGRISTVNLSVDPERTTITANWSQSSRADEYKLVWKTNGSLIDTVYESGRTAKFTNFTPGDLAKLEVQGVNHDRAQEGTAATDDIDTTQIRPGSISSLTLSLEDEHYAVRAKWGESRYADEYKLTWYINGDYDDSYYLTADPDIERTERVSRHTPGDTVKLEIRGVNDQGNQEGPVKSRSIDTTIPLPGRISTLTLELSSDGRSITAKWGTSRHATEYEVNWYVNEDWHDVETIDADADREATFDNFEFGDTVKAVVKGLNDNGNQSGPEISSSLIPPVPLPPAPTVTLEYNSSSNRVEASWNAVEYAVSYEWSSKEGSGSWEQWVRNTGQLYQRTHDPDGHKRYYLKVRGVNSAGRTGPSGQDDVKTPKPDPPANRNFTSEGYSNWFYFSKIEEINLAIYWQQIGSDRRRAG